MTTITVEGKKYLKVQVEVTDVIGGECSGCAGEYDENVCKSLPSCMTDDLSADSFSIWRFAETH